MSKQRIGYDQVREGDLIHVKGSTNTYKAVGEAGMFGIPINAVGLQYVFAGSELTEFARKRLDMTLDEFKSLKKQTVIGLRDFDYATRKQPHKPVPMPDHVGEWFLQARNGEWHRIVVTLIIDGKSKNPMIQCVYPDSDHVTSEHVTVSYTLIRQRLHPKSCVDAETYYRQILPTLDDYDDED